MLKASSNSVKVSAIYKPQIHIDLPTLAQIRYLVGKATGECQWFHRVERTVNGEVIRYRLYDLYIPEQEVSMASVDTSPEFMHKLMKEIKEKAGGYNKQFNEIISSLNCWCHSHVNMAASPSGVDDQQFKEQIENGIGGGAIGPQIMMIWNKRDEYFSRIYDREVGLLFEHVPVEVEYPAAPFDYIDDAVKNKFKKKKIEVSPRIAHPNNPLIMSAHNKSSKKKKKRRRR